MELKGKLDAIDGKIRLLNFTVKKTGGVLTTSDEEVAVRQKGQLTKIILAVSDFKTRNRGDEIYRRRLRRKHHKMERIHRENHSIG